MQEQNNQTNNQEILNALRFLKDKAEEHSDGIKSLKEDVGVLKEDVGTLKAKAEEHSNDIKFLKDLTYYNNSINFKVARAVVDYWYENDYNYLEKLANTNSVTRAVIDRYYNEEYNGKIRTILEFWKIEKELFEFINNYPDKKELLKLIHAVKKKHLIRYPLSEKHALEYYLEEKAPEMIGKKENNLLKNPNFLGFFIHGAVDKPTISILKQKYPDKLLFDGKKIVKIKNL